MSNESGDLAANEATDTNDLPGHETIVASATEASDRRITVDTPISWAKKKRLELLDDLIRNLDILAYAEISTVYYLE